MTEFFELLSNSQLFITLLVFIAVIVQLVIRIISSVISHRTAAKLKKEQALLYKEREEGLLKTIQRMEQSKKDLIQQMEATKKMIDDLKLSDPPKP